MSMGMVNKETATTIPAAGNTGDKIGNLAALHTTAKSDIVAAVNEVTDEQANKADNDEVAPEFNDETAYSTGELVYKDGQLYKFDSDHAAGAWDPTEVTQTSVAAEFNSLKNTIIDQTAGKTFIIVTGLMPLFHDGDNYMGYVPFPFVTKNANYTVALNSVTQNNVGNVVSNTTVILKKNIGFAFKITGTYDYSKCGASINCIITFA